MTCDPEALDPTITVTLTWGESGELVLGPDCPDDGVGLWYSSEVPVPGWTYRSTTAPPSAWVPGNILLAAVLDSSTLPLVVEASGTDTATLEAQKALLVAALGQWPYYVQVDVGPVSLGQWRADPTYPLWGAMAQIDAGLYVASAAVGIPINPVGAP